MLGDKIKEFINKHLDCEDCQRAVEIPSKGICCDRCEHEYRMSDELKKELDELIESNNRLKELETLLNFDCEYITLKHDLELCKEELAECSEAGKLTMAAYLQIKDNALLGEAVNLALKKEVMMVAQDSKILIYTPGSLEEEPILEWLKKQKEGN